MSEYARMRISQLYTQTSIGKDRMTDDLVARVRSPFALTERDAQEIAGSLEARAKRIDELESRLVDKDVRIYSWEQDNEVLGHLLSAKVTENEKLRARIAELASTNSVLRDAVQKFVDYDSTYHKEKAKMMLDYEVAIAAARAALKGEKSEQP